MAAEFPEFIGGLAVALALAATAASLAGAFRAGVLKRIRFGSLELEASSEDATEIRRLFQFKSEEKDLPFEIEQLANYYTQILTQSKISFWFSLIFASLGFAVIVAAAFLFAETSSSATFAQFMAGVVIDAVAGLFFVQSRNAQKSMGEFFDKLRKDRAMVDSKELCESIETAGARDALRVHLALHLAGVEDHQSIGNAISRLQEDSEKG